jgi:heptosyltransferase-3
LWVFSTAISLLIGRGIRPLLTRGPGEEGLVKELARAQPQAQIAPTTSIDELGALLAEAKLSVCNNTGPMHLSVAVGCPTVALFLHMDVARWGHSYAPHVMLDLTQAIANPTQVKDRLRTAIGTPEGEANPMAHLS